MAREVLLLCLSHAFTKFGSKGWEFATPLLLLRFSPDGSLLAPTVFGLTVFVFKFLFGPAAGRWMDQTERMRVIYTGLALQAAGVLSALIVLWLLSIFADLADHDPGPALWVLLGAMVACGTMEALGALISSVAVKKDWVPTIWAPTDSTLNWVNTTMGRIDLVAEIVGPLFFLATQPADWVRSAPNISCG